MDSLIVGMGIGGLYKSVLEELGHTVTTVDPDINKNADFPNVESALFSRGCFDTVHICTPNFTHEQIAHKVAPKSKIVFVEKPGVVNSDAWMQLVNTYRNTRFMLVKNNQWRDNIEEMRELAQRSYTIDINWINNDRVPNPGSWFTTKELSFGGVSRDLMPHLLSIWMALETDYRKADVIRKNCFKIWTLDDLKSTDYGKVKEDGIYDVDDLCKMSFVVNDRVWNLESNWRSMTGDERYIRFHLHVEGNVVTNRSTKTIELGLCPESAYKNMIKECVVNLNNKEFWNQQLEQDIYIHERIQNLEVKNTLY